MFNFGFANFPTFKVRFNAIRARNYLAKIFALFGLCNLDASGKKKKWKIVVDYRRVNEKTIDDKKYPIPNITRLKTIFINSIIKKRNN